MKHPLFKAPADALSHQEETAITQELADAYRQNELGEKRPEFHRIAQTIEGILHGAPPEHERTNSHH